ncbi:MAG: DUF58 domain-containing protein [Bacteroidetes bacterium]|nr:DUF58 domain-containing protein [Bacteroidota bacterium]
MIKKLIQHIRDTHLTNRFFWAWGGVVLFFLISFAFNWFFPVAQAALVMLIVLSLTDGGILYARKPRFQLRRKVPRVLSLGDESKVVLHIRNRNNQVFFTTLIDELPEQLQIRDFNKRLRLNPGEEKEVKYSLVPEERGSFIFGKAQLFVESRIGLLQRQIPYPLDKEVPVYPSIIQMKRFELLTSNQLLQQQGVKRLRRIGHSYEFEQIKNYVRGDDYRSINWKATGRRSKLMVNQYEDERSQQVYCLIDKSRVMRMPFGGLSLMDHAINTSLVVSNLVLKKHDKSGLITFSDKLGTAIKADRKARQLERILQALYREKDQPVEANYELLYQVSRKIINGRSLILLFTNFESTFAMERVLPILRRINRFHLLVVVFFENTEIVKFTEEPAQNLEKVYTQTIARTFLAEKQMMVNTLQQYGIQAVLTPPEELSLNTVNKYLELKSRGLI